MGDTRVRLVERLCRAPESHLVEVEALLNRLEQPGAAPSVALSAPHKDWPHAPLHRLF